MGGPLFPYPFVFASPEETSRLRRGVGKLLGRETEPRVLREEGQDADDGAYWEEEDEGGEWNEEDGSRHLIRVRTTVWMMIRMWEIARFLSCE